MLRISRRLRRSAPFGGDKDRERLYRERQRSILYDAKGNIKLGGLVQLVYEEFNFTALCIIGGLTFVYCYEKIVIYFSQKETEGAKALDRESEKIVRESGKLKSDKFLVKPRRQIEDPDMYDIPSHNSQGQFKSRLLSDDSYSSGRHHDDFSRSK